MKKSILVFLLIALSACSPAAPAEPEPTEAALMELPDLGLAPELRTESWINSSEVLELKDLRGKVVLLNMWTFGCINCKRVLPYIIEWHDSYAEEGLVVIGNHYPEFDYEKDVENVRDAVETLGIEFPVTIDNDRLNWAAYQNRYWPTIYLIDKQGHTRYVKIGEGDYATTEQAIQSLLAEPYQ